MKKPNVTQIEEGIDKPESDWTKSKYYTTCSPLCLCCCESIEDCTCKRDNLRWCIGWFFMFLFFCLAGYFCIKEKKLSEAKEEKRTRLEIEDYEKMAAKKTGYAMRCRYHFREGENVMVCKKRYPEPQIIIE